MVFWWCKNRIFGVMNRLGLANGPAAFQSQTFLEVLWMKQVDETFERKNNSHFHIKGERDFQILRKM